MYSSTANTFINTRQSQSTAKEVELKATPSSSEGGVIFHPLDPDRFFKKQVVNFEYKGKEELTREEEDRFYKKALKTDLL